jgi:hypothetical protein
MLSRTYCSCNLIFLNAAASRAFTFHLWQRYFAQQHQIMLGLSLCPHHSICNEASNKDDAWKIAKYRFVRTECTYIFEFKIAVIISSSNISTTFHFVVKSKSSSSLSTFNLELHKQRLEKSSEFIGF